MQNYSARVYRKEDGETEIYVTGNKCSYHVYITKDVITLRGPGCYETSEIDVSEHDADMPETDLAILVVMLFENGLWPKD